MIDRGRALLARFLPQGAILLAVLTFGAYLAGLVRDRIFARTYGAGPELDAYNAAFVLPELLLDVLVAAGLTAPFVPVFTTLRRDAPGDAAPFAQTVLTLAVGVMTVGCILLFFLAPATVAIIAPGFDAQTQALYLDLFRLMLVTPILFAASITLGEILVAERRFLFYALAPILYNVGIVVGTVLLSQEIGIFAAAVGAILGASLHLGIRVVGMTRSPVRIRPRMRLRMPALHEFGWLMLPKMLAHPIEPITFLFFTSVASTLAAGSITAVSFARNFQSVPVALVGIAISLAAFPSLSGVWAAGDRGAFGRLVRTNLLTIGILTTISAVLARDRRPDRDRGAPRRRRVRCAGRRHHGLGAGGVRDLRPVRGAGPHDRPRPVRHAQHGAPRPRVAGGLRRDRVDDARARRPGGGHRDPARVRGRRGHPDGRSRASRSRGGSGEPRSPCTSPSPTSSRRTPLEPGSTG